MLSLRTGETTHGAQCRPFAHAVELAKALDCIARSRPFKTLRIVALNVFIMLTFSQFEIRVAHLSVPV